MDYEQFKAEYKQVFDAIDGDRPSADFAPDVARLKALAATIEDPANRRSAENRIATIEDVLSYGDGPPLSPAMAQAIRVHAAASAAGGTPQERIARAEAGMAEIGRIAEAAGPGEEASIMNMNESLYMLVLALEPESE
ncbi:hypothetical protein EV644_107319 [Kribbella orskensis]|uniref:Uncharacterized protein n=1 Tax=Kribbella orskensis TaxID=2512216 RepID=A0ABY2BJH7_9ACTN|nr:MULTISPECIES: hypothetical protein [Kribbella]TCN39347.1 hypothetical protein EV642_107319 [Kribbella sp. VKM Ac-2500]TCO21994.1 hypothetical protein EV644_107319 [Kribbella orskensis]